MKIVFVSRLFLPHLGGVEIHLHEIASILGRQGHEVAIITGQHESKLNLFVKKEHYSIYRLPQHAVTTKKTVWKAISELESLFVDADVVHVHDVFWWILPVYFKIRNKIFITFHGWETRYPIPLNAKLHRLLAAVLSQGTIHIGEYIQHFYFDKPDIVSIGGINPKRFTKSKLIKKNNNKQLEFVFIGRLEHDTAVPKYLEFFAELRTKKVDFIVTWVGDGSLREVCEEFGIVTGLVKNISKYLRVADFVCSSSYLSILEAQLLGKIVLAFYSNPLKKKYLEAYPGSEHMLISDSVQIMQKKLAHVLKTSKIRESMQEGAKAFASTQTWEKVVGQYVKLWGYGASFPQLSSNSNKKDILPISVVVTVLNEEKTIRATVLGLLSQTKLPQEVIIVDGGSSDATLDILKKLQQSTKHIDLKIISASGNRSVGRNEGILTATSLLIAITDAGCIPKPNWLAELYAKKLQTKDPIIAGYYEGLPKTRFGAAVVPYALVMQDKVNLDDFLPATRSVLLEKKVFEKYGYFPEEFSDNEDYAYFRKLRSMGVQMSFAQEAVVYWQPRETLRDFYTMIFRFARGDIAAYLFRPKVVSIFARYFAFIFIASIFLPAFFVIFFSYLLWAVYKNKKYVGYGWAYLPILQIVSDIAVMHGSTMGFVQLISRLRSK